MRRFRLALAAIAAVTVCSIGSGSAAPTETVLFSFSGLVGGGQPFGELLMDAAGALYGTTQAGGTRQLGIAYKLTPSAQAGGKWTGTVLHSFQSKNGDGAVPRAGLVADARGTLFGTTLYGGTSGAGTVFQLTPPKPGTTTWTERVLYSFGSGRDGASPWGGLVLGAGSVLFGTASRGGAGGNGTVFSLTPPGPGSTRWSERVLHDFVGPHDGATPVGGLLVDAGGTLYGTTWAGGVAGLGTIFRLTPAIQGAPTWREDVLYSFKGAPNGVGPYDPLIIDAGGTLYGTTVGGGKLNHGIFFALAPPAAGSRIWTESVLYRFTYGNDGAGPIGPLLLGSAGRLFGTTSLGQGPGHGSVFALAPPAPGTTSWGFSLLHVFMNKNDGADLYGGLVADATGALYGTTLGGGTRGWGTVFRVQP